MAVDRRQARIRRERAGAVRTESNGTKLITGIDGDCYERPESLRCAAPRPRVGRQWAMGMPLHGFTLAAPMQTSREECEKRTRG
eukprot:5280041-Pleurochrysis_carterae.AAC.1